MKTRLGGVISSGKVSSRDRGVTTPTVSNTLGIAAARNFKQANAMLRSKLNELGGRATSSAGGVRPDGGGPQS